MIFAGMVKNSLIDYPGLIACVLFTPGCNYDCFYCHNRFLLGVGYDKLDLSDVEDFLQKRRGLIDAVVISGGEPTLQNDLIPYLDKIKKMGYKVKLDTNGSDPEVIDDILDKGLADYYAVDYKAPQARYRDICGEKADPAKVLATINLLLAKGADFEVRTTVIPQLKREDILMMARELPQLPRYRLNAYRVPENYLPEDQERVGEKPYTREQISAFAKEISVFQPYAAAS